MSRGNTTAFGRPGSLNPLEDNSIRGANIYGDEGPHQTMLGLGTVNSQPASRSREFEEADRLAAGNHTIAGMPGIKLDLGNNVGRRSSESLMTASSARMNRATPVSQEPVPRSVAMNIAPSSKPVANSSLKIENDDPFAGLPGVSPAPVPSSLVDEEFVDLTAKLFGDDFAAGGNDIEDDDGWDFDIPVAETPIPAAVTASAPAPLSLNVGAKSASGAKTGYGDVSEEVLKTSEFESPAILEQLLSASSIQAQAIKKEDKSAEPAEASKPAEPAKVEAPVAKEEKPAAAAEKAPEASRPEAKSSNIIGIVAAVLAAIASVAWPVLLPAETEGGIMAYPLLLVASGVGVVVDVTSIVISKKVSNIVLTGAFAVAMIVIFAMMILSHIVGASSVKLALIIAAILQAVCAVIYFNRKD